MDDSESFVQLEAQLREAQRRDEEQKMRIKEIHQRLRRNRRPDNLLPNQGAFTISLVAQRYMAAEESRVAVDILERLEVDTDLRATTGEGTWISVFTGAGGGDVASFRACLFVPGGRAQYWG